MYTAYTILQSKQYYKFTWSLFCPLVTNSLPTLTLGCRSDLSRSVVLTPRRNATFSASVHVHRSSRIPYKLERHSESANLRQRYVNLFRCVRQVAALYSAEVCPIGQW